MLPSLLLIDVITSDGADRESIFSLMDISEALLQETLSVGKVLASRRWRSVTLAVPVRCVWVPCRIPDSQLLAPPFCDEWLSLLEAQAAPSVDQACPYHLADPRLVITETGVQLGGRLEQPGVDLPDEPITSTVYGWSTWRRLRPDAVPYHTWLREHELAPTWGRLP